MNWIIQHLYTPLLSLMKRHPILTAILASLCVVFGFFGFWIGFFQIVALLAPVAILTWVLILRRLKKHDGGGTAEVIAICSYIAITAVATFAMIQIVPYGHNHTNPSTFDRQFEPNWDTPATRALTVRACFGCHSNEVDYPSYAKVAPISWMVASHVSGGRSAVNFSIFKKYGQQDKLMKRVIRVIRNGSMPPSYYTHLGKHPEAKLSAEEIAQLVAGLSTSLKDQQKD